MAAKRDHRNTIGPALRVGDVVAEADKSSSGWRFVLGPEAGAWAHLRLHDGWAGFEAGLPEACRSQSDWELLERNRSLPGSCKIGERSSPSNRSESERRLLLDIPLDEDAPIARRCQAGMADLIKAWGWLSQGDYRSSVPAPGGISDENGPEVKSLHSRSYPGGFARLLDMIQASGWACEARDHGRVVVELQDAGPGRQAFAECEEDGRLRLWIPIDGRHDSLDESRAALGAYLLRLCGRRRLVTATTDRPEAYPLEIRIEVRLSEPLDNCLVGHGLAALAVVGGRSRQEAMAITLGDLAGRYTEVCCPD